MDGVPEWNTARYNLEEVHKASLRARDVVRQILWLCSNIGDDSNVVGNIVGVEADDEVVDVKL